MKPLILLISLLFAFPAASAPLEPLAARDVPALLKPPARGVRVIELWALYCVYCETNLRELAALSASRADIEAVTISTDNIGQGDAIVKRLRSAQAESVPARAYADTSPQRLNYLIDPHWGGETPYTLAIFADGSTRSTSGTLTAAQLEALVKPGRR
jgi:iron complex outermembrane receptor protein